VGLTLRAGSSAHTNEATLLTTVPAGDHAMSAPTVGIYRFTPWLASDRESCTQSEGRITRATRTILLRMKDMCIDEAALVRWAGSCVLPCPGRTPSPAYLGRMTSERACR